MERDIHIDNFGTFLDSHQSYAVHTVMLIPSQASRESILHYCVGICFAPNLMHDIAWSRIDVLFGLSTDKAPLGDDSRSLPLWGVLF